MGADREKLGSITKKRRKDWEVEQRVRYSLGQVGRVALFSVLG